MAAFLSGLANVGSKVAGAMQNPAVQRGLNVAQDISAPYMQAPAPLTPAQATAQPVATSGPGFGAVKPIQDLINKFRARRTMTSAGAGPSPAIGGGGLGYPVAPNLGYSANSVR